jgi:hypothetical protein
MQGAVSAPLEKQLLQGLQNLQELQQLQKLLELQQLQKMLEVQQALKAQELQQAQKFQVDAGVVGLPAGGPRFSRRPEPVVEGSSDLGAIRPPPGLSLPGSPAQEVPRKIFMELRQKPMSEGAALRRRTVVVAKFPKTYTEGALAQSFNNLMGQGKVVHCRIVREEVKCYAFMEFVDEACATEAVQRCESGELVLLDSKRAKWIVTASRSKRATAGPVKKAPTAVQEELVFQL